MSKSEFLRHVSAWYRHLGVTAVGVTLRETTATGSRMTVEFEHPYQRLSPPDLQTTGETLAIAVLSGDSSAADPLVDYLQENGMDAIAEAKRQERERVVNKILATLDSQVEFYKRIRGVMTGSQVIGLLHRIMLHI